MLATTMRRAKINAWTSSKLANTTVLVKYITIFYCFYMSYQYLRKIVQVAVLVMIILVRRQQRLQM